MSPDKKIANIYRRLAAHLKKDINTAFELGRQAQEFARDATHHDIDKKNPYIYAVAMTLQHFYTAMETAFKRIVKDLEGDIPTGDSWHLELLEDMFIKIEGIRPAFISSNIRNDLDRLRRFRHVVRHGYEYELDWSQIEPIVESLNKIIDQIEDDLNKFNSFLIKTAEEIEKH